MYRINPNAYRGVFVLPAEIADDFLLKTSAPLLKTILFMYRNADRTPTLAEIAERTGLPEEEAADALAYWAERGLLTEGDAVPVPAQAEQDAPETPVEKPQKKMIDPRPVKPTYDVICKRIQESAAVRALFAEAQLKLGRTIGTGDQGSLLLLHDYYGLPVEIILTICEYARSHGKANNISYIYTMGVDWSKREIDTLELADAEFKKLEGVNAVWSAFRAATGVKNPRPTAPQQKYFTVWTEEWRFPVDMLALAYEEMSKNTQTVSFPYMNRILSEWQRAGIRTPEAAAEREKKFTAEKEKRAAEKAKPSPYAVKNAAQQPERPASYDIEKATDKMKTTVPTLKKKEKR